MSSLKQALEEKLNDAQLKFAIRYFETMDAPKSAIEAGYSKKTAPQTASRLLTQVNVSAYLRELKREFAERSEVTVDRCVRELACMAFVDVGEAYDEDGNLKNIADIPEDVRRAISTLTIGREKSTIRFHGKRDSIETIMKYLGAFEKDNDQKRGFDLSKIPTDLLRDLMKHL